MNAIKVVAVLGGITLAPSSLAVSMDVGNTKLSIGGFIKVDASFSKYNQGRVAGSPGGEDFIFPSRIPVGSGDDSKASAQRFNMNAKTSRLFVKTSTQTDAGKIDSHLEMDFATESGNELVSNSSSQRLRHAYFRWSPNSSSNLLVGQSWSTFFNVGALPEAVDFVGPTSGTIFVRQAQVRWTNKFEGGALMLAVENPSSLISGEGITDDAGMPDIIARYDTKVSGLNLSAALLARQIGIDDGAKDDQKIVSALSFSGKWNFSGGNNLKFMVSSGVLGRYIGLSAFSDGVLDADGNMDETKVTGGFIAYHHKWTKKLRSNFMYAMSSADLPESLKSAATTKDISNINLNLMYSPTPKLTFGGALINADRKLANDAEGKLNRIQFTGKYSF